MLGSLTDADDVMQEVLLAAWQGLETFAGRSSVRTWLYRIATNRCLNAIRAGERRALPEPIPPFAPPEPSRRDAVTWLQPYPDSEIDQATVDPAPGPAARYQAREAIELAFIAALQRLPPRQAAAVRRPGLLHRGSRRDAGDDEHRSQGCAATSPRLSRSPPSRSHC